MPMQKGLLLTCDRCGFKQFFSDDGEPGRAEVYYSSSKWRIEHNKHLCPKCADKYQAWIYQFFDKVVKEETNNDI